uniref:Uncharacterized protein n=1 Tax=Tetraselmis sp. GSL018 TaxID=582737 RepID=A0A061R1L5_9CHLO
MAVAELVRLQQRLPLLPPHPHHSREPDPQVAGSH